MSRAASARPREPSDTQLRVLLAIVDESPERLARALKSISRAELSATLQMPEGQHAPLLAVAVQAYAEAVGEGRAKKVAAALSMLEQMLRAGADPNVVNTNPLTGNVLVPWMQLSDAACLAGLQLLLAQPALDVMLPCAERSRRAMWPLQLAIHGGNTAGALALIAHASFDAGRDPRPLLAAAENNNTAVVAALLA